MDNTLPIAHKKARRTLSHCLMRGILSALFLMLLMIVIGAVVAYNSPDPTSLIRPLAYGISGLSAALCGLITARLRGGQGLICGLLSGLGLTLFFLLFYFLLGGAGTTPPARLALFYLLLPALSLLGGVLGTVKRTPARRVHHAKRR